MPQIVDLSVQESSDRLAEELIRTIGEGITAFNSARRPDPSAGPLVLAMHEFQSPGFYRSHGYEVFGELDDYPDGEKHLYFKKHLGSTGNLR